MTITTRTKAILHAVAAFVVLGATGATLPAAQREAITSQRNLSEMVDESGVIVRGHILSTVVEPHPRYPALWTVVVTLQVDETLKGQTGDTYTFRQFIWDRRDRADGALYQKSSQVLLLLLKPNGEGLSSPAGLEQGRFILRADGSGRVLATNGRNNVGLMNGVAAQVRAQGLRLAPQASVLVTAPRSGPVALDDLRDLIRQFAGAN